MPELNYKGYRGEILTQTIRKAIANDVPLVRHLRYRAFFFWKVKTSKGSKRFLGNNYTIEHFFDPRKKTSLN